MCCDGWDLTGEGELGECPDCGGEVVDGNARYGCNYSPEDCKTCGSRSCDGSC